MDLPPHNLRHGRLPKRIHTDNLSQSAVVFVDGKSVALGLWDFVREDGDLFTPGLTDFAHTDVFILQYDISRPKTLESVRNRYYPLVHHHCPGVPIILVGNKVGQR